jgi:hypothetical protein
MQTDIASVLSQDTMGANGQGLQPARPPEGHL